MEIASRLAPFGVTIFTEITALANEVGAINLSQGFPDWDGPKFVKEAAVESLLAGGADQYPPMSGIPQLRGAIAARYGPLLGRELDPDSEVTVTSGCTEGLASALLGLVEPGDEVVVIEPYYDAYPVDIALAGARMRPVTLDPPEFRLDPDRLASVFSNKTRAIIVNTPHNPTGRVFDRHEMDAIAELCIRHDAIAVCDDVYEEIVFEGEHIRLATLDGMADRTITLSSVGKTYSVTGWKVGWAVASAALTAGIRAAHQFLTFTTPTPVQHGTVAALSAPPAFYSDLRDGYRARRDLLVNGLEMAGFDPHQPAGSYFVMAGYSRLSDECDRDFVRRLLLEAGVATIPPSAFYQDSDRAERMVRFAFCKDPATLTAATDRLRSFSDR